MIRSGLSKMSLIVAAGLLLGSGLNPARADDSAVNPKYSAWSNFKPGSSSTVEADMTVQGNKIHIQMVKTLISIDAEKAVVQTQSTVNVLGHDNAAPARTETISAKGDDESYKQIGEKDVEAIGKTFKCKAYEATRSTSAAPAKPISIGDAGGSKATVYISDEVPGGLVRLEGVGQTGQDLTFILTAMDVK